jgi:hypothetical protein
MNLQIFCFPDLNVFVFLSTSDKNVGSIVGDLKVLEAIASKLKCEV